VVVLDRDLPGLHGDTLCQMITADGPRPMVLMLSAAGSPHDRVESLTLGADDYLPKPFHFPELVLRCRALARRRPQARGRILWAAGLELDAQLRTATRDGVLLSLSVKEFELLQALLQAAPGYLRAEDLLEQVRDETPTVHQHGNGHDRPAAPQSGQPGAHHNHRRRRLPHSPLTNPRPVGDLAPRPGDDPQPVRPDQVPALVLLGDRHPDRAAVRKLDVEPPVLEHGGPGHDRPRTRQDRPEPHRITLRIERVNTTVGGDKLERLLDPNLERVLAPLQHQRQGKVDPNLQDSRLSERQAVPRYFGHAGHGPSYSAGMCVSARDLGLPFTSTG
jgi:CheY-like chemotaxis protein